MVIIWPLIAKLGPVAWQQRPIWTGRRGIPEPPSLPWDDNDRPPAINFGLADRPPIAVETAPTNFGLCAMGLQSVKLTSFLHPQRPRAFTEQTRTPAVVEAKPPATMTRFTFAGVSRDSTGAALANCQVLVFRTYDNVLVATTTSDGSGNWSVIVDRQQRHYFVEYRAGTPDVFGTSLNDRVPS